ncbi:16894_t:CDS:2, partial [Cetraspora pellucida]
MWYTYDETIYEIGIQASAQTNEIGVQVNKKTHKIKDLKKQLKYTYDYIVESWDHIQEINK